MHSPQRNPTDPVKTFILIAVVGLVLGAAAMAVAVRDQEHNNKIAHDWTAATARVMAHLAERSLQSITLSLDEIADDVKAAAYFGRPPGPWLNRHFSTATEALPQVMSILLTDARGTVAVSWYDGANGPTADLGDRDYVRVWLDGSTDDFYVSQPLQLRVIGDWWFFAISRPVRGPDGSVIGVLAALVAIDYFEALFQETIESPGEVVALVNQDGQLLVTAGTDLGPGGQLPDPVAEIVRRHGPHPAAATLSAGQGAAYVHAESLDAFGLSALAAAPQETLFAAMTWPGVAWAALWAAACILIRHNARHQARQSAAQRLIEQHAEALERVAHDLQTAKGRAEAARVEAEAANQAKSRFLALMSHELRTPLNAILGFAELIRDQPLGVADTAHHSEYAADIHASGRHLLDLINDILDLAKIDSGRLELDPQPTDLKALLSDVQTVIGPRCAARHVRITTDVAAGLAGVCADRRGLKQILLNLLDNAAKAMHQAGTIAVGAHLRPDGAVEISVTDTGIGIPAERLASLFQPFEQVDNRYAKSNYGVGLGLVLVKRLTELHNGTLEVESRSGEGTRVSVILPRERAILTRGSKCVLTGSPTVATPPPSAVAAA